MERPTVAVIGAGFSGSLLSLWLQSLAPVDTRIWLVERTRRVGSGLAYGATAACHLLNVPAGDMGAFPDQPGDFLQWLRRQPAAALNGVVVAESAFVPRHLYGTYLGHLLHNGLHASHCPRLEVLHDEVLALDDGITGIRLRLASGNTLRVDVVVLATGNAPPLPPHPNAAALDSAGLWRADPWSPAAFANLDENAAILLVGTGLTMVDAVCTLLDRGHRGSIHALSRHGLLPRRHADQRAAAVPISLPTPLRLNDLMRVVREEIARSMAAGHGWHPVIDSLRPLTQDLWRGMNLTDRKRFLRHVRAWWDAHRHRMPARSAHRIDQALASGQLCVHAGRITNLASQDSRATVVYRRAGTYELHEFQVDRVVNCTGAGADITRSVDALTSALLQSGLARPDPLHLGFELTADGAAVGRTGTPSQRIFAIGPVTKSSCWEITAVPDIRRQCRELAQTVSNLLARKDASRVRGAGATAAAAGRPANLHLLPSQEINGAVFHAA